jgi:enamine deaminase RidA (YjgF/YER057c/UK114 family)
MPRYLSVALHDSSSPRPIHGVLTSGIYKRLVVSALPGVRPDGTLPDGLPAQAEQAFENLAQLIEIAGLKREDIVSIAAYVAASGAKAMLHRVAATKLGGLRPATAVRQVVSLSQAGCMVEIDAEILAEN